MAYEKKTEPISKWEVILQGLSLQLWIIFASVLPWGVLWTDECREIVFTSSVSSMDDLIVFHDCINKHQNGILEGCACLLLAYPFGITHIYALHRAMDTLGGFLTLNMFKWLYCGSWFAIVAIWCTIAPALGIFIAYYDWEFDAEYRYSGYALQFEFTHLFLIICDSVILALGFVAALPWCWQLCVALGFCQSKYYTFDKQEARKIFSKFLSCPKCTTYIFGLFSLAIMCVIFFASVADVFDFEKEGFFSYSGGSQYLVILVLISMEILSITIMIFGCNMEKGFDFLKDNVKSTGYNRK